MVAETKIYEQGRLTFIISPTRITVKTPLQSFYLVPKTHYYSRRLKLIESMIMLGEIRDLNELASFCANGNVCWVASGGVHL